MQPFRGIEIENFSTCSCKTQPDLSLQSSSRDSLGIETASPARRCITLRSKTELNFKVIPQKYWQVADKFFEIPLSVFYQALFRKKKTNKQKW